MVDQLSFESISISSHTVDMVMYSSGESLHLCLPKKTMTMLPKLNHIDKADLKNDKKTSTNQNSKKNNFDFKLDDLNLLYKCF